MQHNKKKPAIYLVIDHPVQILSALGLLHYYSNKYTILLLVSLHPYWNKKSIAFVKQLFPQSIWFSRPTYSWIIPRELIKFWIVWCRLKKLPVDPTVFIFLSNKIWLECLILKLFTKAKTITLHPSLARNKHLKEYFSENLISRIWKQIFHSFNVPSILYGIDTTTGRMSLVYEKDETLLFDQVLYLSNSSDKSDKSVLQDPARLASQQLQFIARNTATKIIFFGDAINQQKLSKYHIRFTNKCLRFIEQQFPDGKLLYKPHPHDQFEQSSISLGRFRTIANQLPAEIYLLQHNAELQACFSISSLATKHALIIGIPSYYFLGLYRHPNTPLKKVLWEQTEHMDSRATIHSFQQKIQLYKPHLKINVIKKSLAKIIVD